MTYVSFIIRRNGTKIRRIAGVKTPDEALDKFAKLTRRTLEELKASGYTAEEIPAETQAEIGARMDARHSKWFHGRSGASKVADRLVRQAQRRGESTPAKVVNQLLEDCGKPGCALSPAVVAAMQAVNKEGSFFDEQELMDIEQEYIRKWQPGWGYAVGGYVYYPVAKRGKLDFANWEASDGDRFRAGSLLDLVLGWGGQDEFDDFIHTFPEDNGKIVKKKVDQQGYEGGRLKGDFQ